MVERKPAVLGRITPPGEHEAARNFFAGDRTRPYVGATRGRKYEMTGSSLPVKSDAIVVRELRLRLIPVD